MDRKLHSEPVFDISTLREKADAWKKGGASRVIVEWSTGTGPTIYYFPDGDRRLGVKWTVAVETYNYNEVYADYLEYKLVPQLLEAFQARGLMVAVICVDQQPLLVQRMRRRSIERIETAAHAH